jgi:hypothetical protein
MSRNYLNRYQYFVNNQGNFTIVPGIELPIKGTDKYVQYVKGKDRLDKISQQYYDSPTFGWLIMQANPLAGGIEFQIPDKFILRIPYPLTTTLQDYKSAVDLYNLYYGQQ